MVTEPFTPVDIPAFGAPVKCSAGCGCGGSCGCGGGGGCGGGCGGGGGSCGCGGGGGCGGGCSCGAAPCGGAIALALPPENCTESPWVPCPSGGQPSLAAGGGSDAIDQALFKVEQVRQAVLGSVRTSEGGGARQLGALCGVVCLGVMTSTGYVRGGLAL